MHFAVLASGSAGNASLVRDHSFGVLIDLGIGPRSLAQRLAQADATWEHIHAALLTHLHTDHWNDGTLHEFTRRGVPLYCHARHAASLQRQSPAFAALEEHGLVRLYEVDAAFCLGPGWRASAFSLPHDGGLTCGFRIDGQRDVCGDCWSLGYAADLGSWDTALVQRLSNVDVLALEFNHDEDMQVRSERPRFLVERALSERGHLSNHTAASLVAEIVRRSEPGRLRHLVQLHLSRQCNEAALARAAVAPVLVGTDVEVYTARQDQCAGPIEVVARRPSPARVVVAALSDGSRERRAKPRTAIASGQQPWLPGWE